MAKLESELADLANARESAANDLENLHGQLGVCAAPGQASKVQAEISELEGKLRWIDARTKALESERDHAAAHDAAPMAARAFEEADEYAAKAANLRAEMEENLSRLSECLPQLLDALRLAHGKRSSAVELCARHGLELPGEFIGIVGVRDEWIERVAELGRAIDRAAKAGGGNTNWTAQVNKIRAMRRKG